MAYVRIDPGAPLDAFVATLWANERPPLAARRERLLPTGRADIVISLSERPILRFDDGAEARPAIFRRALLSGPSARTVIRDTSQPTSVVGIHFRPGGLAAFVREPVDRLTGSTFELEDVLGPFAIELRERLLEATGPHARLALVARALRARLLAPGPVDPMVQWAIGRFEADPSSARVSSIQKASGTSPGTFIDRFRRVVGLTPKHFARVLRAREALHRLAATAGTPRDGSASAARIALETGFSDQAHLVRELRAIAGLTPTGYRPEPGQPEHVPIDAAEPGRKIFKPAARLGR